MNESNPRLETPVTTYFDIPQEGIGQQEVGDVKTVDRGIIGWAVSDLNLEAPVITYFDICPEGGIRREVGYVEGTEAINGISSERYTLKRGRTNRHG